MERKEHIMKARDKHMMPGHKNDGSMDAIKKKILLVSCKGLGKGGVQAVLMSIVRNLSSKYTFDIVLFTEEKGYYEEEFTSFGGKIIRIPNYEGNNQILRKIGYFLKKRRMYRKIKKCINENGPYCAIHCNNYFDSAYCLKAAYECGVPVRISHIHAIIPKPVFFLHMLENKEIKIIKRASTCLIACSEKAFSYAFGTELEPRVVPNSYDGKKFDINKYECPKPDFLSITQVGYFCANKNQIFSLHILYQIKKTIPNVRLNLVGFDVDGYKSELEQCIKDLNLQDNVVFYPSDADTPKLLSESHVALVPSVSEGFGIVSVEAQAMGVHVFASDALPKITDAGGCTFLPLSLGYKEWADSILKWYEENKDIPQIYDCSAFTESSIVNEYEKIYEGLK